MLLVSLAFNAVILAYSYYTRYYYNCMNILLYVYSALVFEYEPLDVRTFEGDDETVSFKCNASSNSKYTI